MLTIQPTAIDAKILRIVEDYLNGDSITELAQKYNKSAEEITGYLTSKPVEKYITSTLANLGYLNPKSRVSLLNQIIDQKLDLALENDLPISKKDIVDVIKLLQEEQKLNSPKEEPEAVNINYLKLVEEIKN